MPNENGNNNETVNIRPAVGYLSILQAINYRAWYAIAEFVDNSIQSYVDNKSKLKKLHGNNFKLKIAIYVSKSKIQIIDNAAGINEKDFPRAFRAAARPENRKGLSEFGMGMKTAACWFSPFWIVKTKPLDEKELKIVKFDIKNIVRDEIEELEIKKSPLSLKQHYTEITLTNLIKVPHGQTIKRMKEHLSSMYRCFIEKNEVEIRYNNEKLKYETPEILEAPYFKDVDEEKKNPKKIYWHKKLDFKYGKKYTATGYIAIRETASTKHAGFALFRRNRLIKGVGENEGYRPLEIFKAPNSFIYQRVFGEIHLDDEKVTHTKDGFQWTLEEESEFLKKLKEISEKAPKPILSQSDRFRKDRRSRDLKIQSEEGLESSIKKIPKGLTVLENFSVPKKTEIPEKLPEAKSKDKRRKTIYFDGHSWIIEQILNYDKNETEWLTISEKGKRTKEIQIQIAMGMGFTAQYFGDQPDEIEGMLLLASYIALAEVVARDRGDSKAHTIRLYLNEILRNQPPKIYY